MKKVLLTSCALLCLGTLPVVNAKLIHQIDAVEPGVRNGEVIILDSFQGVHGVRKAADKKTTPSTEDPQSPDEIQD